MEKKFYYADVYWAYLAVSLFLTFLAYTLSVQAWVQALVIVLTLYTIYMVYLTHKALAEVGWDFGWLFGLILFLPFGVWVVFFFVRWKLKKVKKWSRKD